MADVQKIKELAHLVEHDKQQLAFYVSGAYSEDEVAAARRFLSSAFAKAPKKRRETVARFCRFLPIWGG